VLRNDVERRPARHWATRRGDHVCAEQRELRLIDLILATRRVICDRPTARSVPRHVMGRIVPGQQITPTQQPPGVGADEQRSVGPAANEVAIEPVVVDHYVRDREPECRVGSGAHTQPVVGSTGQAGAARIDDDEAGTAVECGDSARRVGESRDRRVVAPVQDASGVVEIRHVCARHSRAVGVRRCEVATPATQLHIDALVRTAKRPSQTHHPVERIGHRRRRGGSAAERDSLGTVVC
jgi:hypothetical protein